MPAAHTFLKPVLLLAILFVIGSCKTKSNDDLIKLMQENAMESNTIITQLTERILEDLNRRQYEPAYLDRVLVWFPKAKQIYQICDSAYNYIDSIKESDRLAKNQIFQLFRKLKEYNNNLLKVDAELDSAFRRNLSLLPGSTGPATTDSAAFSKRYFDNSSEESQKAFLLQLKNKIIIVKNRFITECANKCRTNGDAYAFGYYLPLFSQNSYSLF